MNKILPKITSLFTISVFVVAVVLCCCTQQSAHASTQKNVPACHAKKATTDTPAHQTDCSCCTSKQLQADSGAKVSLQAPSYESLTFSIAQHISVESLVKQKLNLAYLDGPPGQLSEVPLYLLFRSIRC